MKKFLTLALLVMSMTLWSQVPTVDMNEDPTENIVAQMNVCFPITYYSDSIVTLLCSGVYIEMPAEKLKQQFVIVINPNNSRDSISPGKSVIQYFLPEENNDPALTK